MFGKVLLSLVFLISTVACITFAHAEPKVEFEGIYWITDLKAEAKVTENNIGTDVDFKADLGLKDKNFPEGRFTWYTGPKSKLRLAYAQIGYSGDKILIPIAGHKHRCEAMCLCFCSLCSVVCS
ncbi:MAG: hypothetical protein IBX72_11300 [Nitrospirae bacterium]|nr:hypothetical protein [Nitrospirota bacterium]